MKAFIQKHTATAYYFFLLLVLLVAATINFTGYFWEAKHPLIYNLAFVAISIFALVICIIYWETQHIIKYLIWATPIFWILFSLFFYLNSFVYISSSVFFIYLLFRLYKRRIINTVVFTMSYIIVLGFFISHNSTILISTLSQKPAEKVLSSSDGYKTIYIQDRNDGKSKYVYIENSTNSKSLGFLGSLNLKDEYYNILYICPLEEEFDITFIDSETVKIGENTINIHIEEPIDTVPKEVENDSETVTSTTEQ